jgi:hypothetical protein
LNYDKNNEEEKLNNKNYNKNNDNLKNDQIMIIKLFKYLIIFIFLMNLFFEKEENLKSKLIKVIKNKLILGNENLKKNNYILKYLLIRNHFMIKKYFIYKCSHQNYFLDQELKLCKKIDYKILKNFHLYSISLKKYILLKHNIHFLNNLIKFLHA